MKRSTAAVIWRDYKILLAHRSKDDFWEFPGGRIDPGETPEECIVREIKEELDIDIQLDQYLGKVTGHFRGRDMRLYAFFASWVSGQIALHVHRDVQWVDPHELNDFSIIEEDRKIKEFILSEEGAIYAFKAVKKKSALTKKAKKNKKARKAAKIK